MHILIAEDDATSRAILEKMCRKSGDHHVALAENGQAAWALVDDPKRWFDVVFLDVQMPELGGLDVLQRIRQSSVYRSIEVVMCTAANDRITITKAMELGVRHYIIKPCSEAAVTEKLRLIDEKRLAGAR